MARVDERLLHGQVMTNLSKSAGANALFIVDDEVAKDDFMKTIFLSSGARTGLTVKIFSEDEAVAYWNEKEFEKYNAIVITKNIKTIYSIIKKGIPVKDLNLGGIAKKPTTTFVINAVAIDQEMADMLKELAAEDGVNCYFQAVPSSQRVELKDALKDFQ